MNSNELPWTGERLVPTIKNDGAIEHLHRYAFALDFVENRIVADIASGEGYGSNLLSQKAKMVYGIDIDKESIHHANKKYGKNNLQFKEGYTNAMPLESNIIDTLVSFETIEHIDKQEEMFFEIKRVLKEDGVLIISSPERSNYGDQHKAKNHFHVKELYLNEFEGFINKHFRHSVFFKQKFIAGSIITPSESINDFIAYSGDYSLIDRSNTIKEHTFNICVASDNSISYKACSLFHKGSFQSVNVCELEIRKAVNEILNSNTFKVGEIVTMPFKKIKNIFK